MRLSSLIENDIAALETGHRGFLLTGKPDYLAGFERRKASIEKDIQDLTRQLGENETQQKRVLKAREIVQKWIDTTGLPEIESRKKLGRTPMRNPNPVGLKNLSSIRRVRFCNRYKTKNKSF